MLSGTSYRPAVPQQLIDLLNDAVRKEPLGDSAVWAGLFKDFNKPFGGPTGFEWLSRDSSEMKKYVDDLLCGFAFSNELMRDFLWASRACATRHSRRVFPSPCRRW